MNLKIILSQDNFIPSLKILRQSLPSSSTEIYCLCADNSEFNQLKKEYENIKKEGLSFRIFTRHEFNSSISLANHFFLNDASQGYLFFLSSNILPEKDSLKKMLAYLERNEEVAGVNPLLYADWIADQEKRIAFMGLSFDCQKKLHYLYEGILADNHLTRKERFFQIAHPGCLLIRSCDFKKADGFKEELGFLAYPDLCIQIRKFRPNGYCCIPEARGKLKYKFDSWSFCGAWNSILQRGRLDTSNIKVDYADFYLEDKVEYGCDNWLEEGPLQIPDLSDEPSVKIWQQWRYHPNPGALLSFLSSLSVEERFYGLELARNRPACLPQTMQYYKVQAEKIKSYAEENQLSLVSQIDQWLTKTGRFHYGELKPGIRLLHKAGIYNCSLDICPAIFDAWVEIGENFERLDVSDSWPEIAVVMPVWNPNPDFLRQAIDSVLNQTYSGWQLCIADDASTKSGIRPILESFAQKDERIKIKYREENGHICRATNTALEMVDSPFTAFLDHDDLLSPHALAEVAALIAKKPDLGFIYTDDDRINEYNVRRSPVFRPDFDCDLFYTGHLSTYYTNLIREAGGLRIGTEGSQDTDLRFRVTELLDNGRIAHIPRILYHWRVHEESTASSFLAKPYVYESGRRVFLEAATRQGRNATWGDRTRHKFIRLLYFPKKRYKCSIVLLVDDVLPSKALLETITELKKYVEVEIYAQPLRETSPRMERSHPFVGENIICACNAAAMKVDGELIIFLLASLVPDRNCRLEQLVELAMTPHIAMASGNIWFGEKLANGGWYPNEDGLPFPLLQGMNRNEVKNSAWGQMNLVRHVLGAPWQCMAVKKELCGSGHFLDENYGTYATVNFGLEALAHNKFVAITPWVNWQINRMPVEPEEKEINYILQHGGRQIADCGLRNPNLRAAANKDWTIIL